MAAPEGYKLANRRFTVEEIDNGWLLKIAELGSEKLTGRLAFMTLGDLLDYLEKELTKD